MSPSQQLKVLSGYIVVSLFIISGIILLYIIAHLIYVAIRTHKKGDNNNNKPVTFLIIITLIGIISFEISLLLIIAVIVQILLIDAHQLSPSSNSFHKFYYQSFEEMEYMIPIFDQFGHLAMITVFIIRLKMCFENTLFGYSKYLLRFICICLIILTTASLIIIIEIVNNDQHINIIIICEIIWEIFVEIMCLWLLHLFVSKLNSLMIMSLEMTQLNVIINHVMLNRKHKKKQSEESKSSISVNMSPAISQNSYNYDGQIIYLINVMTKMCVLVIIAVIGSLLSVIGNIFIGIHELKTIKQHTINIESIYIFLLPVMDMIITSICLLYLQFNFTQNTYLKICNKIDILFLRFCGNVLKHMMKNSKHKDIPFTTQQNKDGEAGNMVNKC